MSEAPLPQSPDGGPQVPRDVPEPSVLDLVARRTQYSLRELFAAYWKLKKPEKRATKNPLSRERAMFCSAFVQHVYLKIGIDFAPDVDTKLTSPHDIAVTPVPHTTWILRR